MEGTPDYSVSFVAPCVSVAAVGAAVLPLPAFLMITSADQGRLKKARWPWL